MGQHTICIENWQSSWPLLAVYHSQEHVIVVTGQLRTFWSPCGRRDEVVGGPRRLLVTSRTSSWVVPPPKVVFYRDG